MRIKNSGYAVWPFMYIESSTNTVPCAYEVEGMKRDKQEEKMRCMKEKGKGHGQTGRENEIHELKEIKIERMR